MICAEFSKMLDEYESLSTMQKAELKEHALSCDECRTEYELFMSMLDATRTLPQIKVDDSFLKSLNARIDKEVVAAPVHKSVWEHLKLNAHRYSAVAACIALVAVIGVNSADFIKKLTNPYQEYIEPVSVVDSPVEEPEEDPEDIASTTEPTETPEQSAKPTVSPTATATPKATAPPKVTATPKATTSPRVTARATTTPRVVATPRPTTAPRTTQNATSTSTPATTQPPVVFDQPPANSPMPSQNPEVTVAPTPTSEPYTVEQSQYVLPASAQPVEGRSIEGQGYSIGDTSNYLKVSRADSEKVQHIVARYSQDAQGGVYLMTEEGMEIILQILAQEGIEFDNSITVATDGNVAFKLIIS